MSRSIFTNSNIGKRTVLSAAATTNMLLINENDFIKQLMNTSTVTYITNVMNLYYAGNFEEAYNLLSPDIATRLMNDIYNYKKESFIYPTYEKVRNNLKLYLEQLIQQSEIYSSLKETESQLSQSQLRASILDNMTKLQEYINTLNKTMYLFNIQPQQIITAEILPEHAEYIITYGYPPGGVFDQEKLAGIIYQLNIKTNT